MSEIINTIRPMMINQPGTLFVIHMDVDGYPFDTFRVSGICGHGEFTLWRRHEDGWRQIGGFHRNKYDAFDAIAADEKTMESPDD